MKTPADNKPIIKWNSGKQVDTKDKTQKSVLIHNRS